MIASLKDTLDECGYVFLSNYRSDLDARVVSSSFGIIDTLPRVGESQVLRPRNKADAPLNIYSGNFGYGEFPLHTDLAHWFTPPRYFVLRCITGADAVATYLLNADTIIAAIGSVALRRTLVQPRRRFEHAKPLLSLYDCRRDRSFFRWDQLFIAPASRSSSTTFAAVSGLVSAASPEKVVLRQPGDTLIVDNGRILHGRSAVTEQALQRRVERVYLRELK